MVQHVVFFHDRQDWLLALILYALERQDVEVTVIGTKAYSGIGACQHSLEIDDIMHSSQKAAELLQTFERTYTSVTVNDYTYEKACFLRWFYLYAYSIAINREFLYLDSDYLLSSCFDVSLLPETEYLFYDTPFINVVSPSRGAEQFLEFLINVQVDGNLLAKLSTKYSINGKPHFSDMNALYEYGLLGRCTALTNQLLSLGLCPNISIKGDYHGNGPIRHVDVDHNAARFFCTTLIGKQVEFYSLHFQGYSKCLAPLFVNRNILNQSPWGRSILNLYRDHIQARDGYFMDPVGVSMRKIIEEHESQLLRLA
jgi:hypothetical protein